MTRRALFAWVAVGSIAAALCADPARAPAGETPSGSVAPPPPADLEVSGGEDRWHASSDFRLDWRVPDLTLPFSIAAVHFRVRSATGVVVPDTRIAWAATVVDGIEVPAPGTYTAEVWLENLIGEEGVPAAAKLRFDNVRPGGVKPLATPRWIGRAALPLLVRLSHPADPLPQSGVRGYAVSVDGSPNGGPCVAADRCTEAETDLRGGVSEDSDSIMEPPEGTSYVHAVAVSGSGMKSGVTGSVVVHVDTVDPVTRLSGLLGGWTNRPVPLQATATDSTSGMDADGAGGPFTAIRIDGGAPAIVAGPTAGTTVISEGMHTIAYYARDAAGNVNDGVGGNREPMTATVRIDRTPPATSFANAQRPEDPELIEVRVSDSLSGPDLSKGWVAMRRSGSGEPFEPLSTEAGGGRLQARWDSDAYPTGKYEFRATGYDEAGNSFTTDRRANGASMVLPNPLKVSTALATGFGAGRLAARRCERRGNRRRGRCEAVSGFDRRPSAGIVPYGRSTLYNGRLTAGQTALPQMPIRIVEHFDRGAERPDRVTTVKTGADGIFVARLAPGPSRQVLATFEGTRTLTRSSGAPNRLGVRGGIRMRSSAAVAAVGGRPIVFSGGVETGGAAIPAEGKTIQLQFRLPGLSWAEFRTIQTDATGHFHYAYRFADDDSRGVRFRFRAFAAAQDGWPYEPASSRPVAVRGR